MLNSSKTARYPSSNNAAPITARNSHDACQQRPQSIRLQQQQYQK
jgi:hypothetical protein